MDRTDLLNIINGYPITERILLVEAILKQIREEREAYEESLKHYRDLKNVVDTSRKEGIREVAKRVKIKGMPNSEISELTGLKDDEIDEL
jgi:RNA-splicing ligase RtcB